MKWIHRIINFFKKENEFNPVRIVTPKDVHFVFEVIEKGKSHILDGYGFCWFSEKPCDDDGLLCTMQSGRKVLYRFFNVQRFGNPNDMYVAKAEPMRYVDDEIKN